MITEEHLKMFYKYNGDGEGFVRMCTIKEKEAFDPQTWTFIEDLASDLFLIHNTKVSEEFSKNIELKLISNCDSSSTIESLHKYATKKKD